EHAALNLLHHHWRRGDNFGQGGEVEDRVVGGGRGTHVEGQRAEGLAPERLARGADLDDGCRKCAFGDRTLEELPGSVETEAGPRRADSASVQEPANAPRPIPVRNSVPFGGLIRLSYENRTMPRAPARRAAPMPSIVSRCDSRFAPMPAQNGRPAARARNCDSCAVTSAPVSIGHS